MEKLSDQQVTGLRKMSDDRLRAKLVEAGYNADDVADLRREALLQTYARLLAEEAEQASGGGTKDEEYDDGRMSFEERRLMVDERRLEEQRLQRELEERRLALEERKMEMQRVAAERDYSQKESVAMRLKTWGEAIRNTITKMPAEPIEMVTWFISLERLFDQLKVPAELQSVLIRPYLSERAKSLLARCDPVRMADYGAIKHFLLQEMRLAPSTYIDKFKSIVQDKNETYVSFGTRLLALFQYYVESRHVCDYERLVDLVVYDRVKSTLSPALSRYVLALEAASKDGWLGRKELLDSLDNYLANLSSDHRANTSQRNVNNFARKANTAESRTANNNTCSRPNEVSSRRGDDVSGVNVTGTPVKPDRQCFICSSRFHIARNCPYKDQGQKTGSTANVNACASRASWRSNRPHRQTMNEADAAKGVVNNTGEVGAQVEQRAASTVSRVQVASDSLMTAGGDGWGHGSPGQDCEVIDRPTGTQLLSGLKPKPSDPVLAAGWSQLRYLPVDIQGVGVVSGLDDSGTEICCVHTDVVRQCELPVIGHVVLRGISSENVPADLVSMKMKLPGNRTYVDVTCAVCGSLTNELILGSDVIQRLIASSVNDSDVVCNDAAVKAPMPSDESSNQTEIDTRIDTEDVNVSQINDTIIADVDVNQTDDVVNGDGINSDGDDNVDENDINGAVNKSVNVRKASADTLKQEQLADKSLKLCWSLAQRGKGNYFVRDGILYRLERILGQEFEQLCLPSGRRTEAIKLAHETFGGHLAAKKTKARLKLSFTWPTIASDVQRACETCDTCQKRRRVTVYDRVPIAPVPRDDQVFHTFVMDCLGPLAPNQNVKYNYALVLCDSCSRYPVAFALTSLSSKNVCNALLQMFQTVGVPGCIQSDCASNFSSELTRTFLSMLGCTPRFNVPGRPQQTGLCERLIGTLKSMIAKVAMDHPRSWHKHLPSLLWALRETPNETLGVPPWVMVYGRLPRGPLAILKENWSGQRDLPLNLGKSTVEYLRDLRKDLELVHGYANSHAEHAQQRYISRYNLRAREKTFTPGQRVLVLAPDTTKSKVFSKWQGPAVIVEKRSGHSYIVELNGAKKHMHADKLREYKVSINQVTCNMCASYDANQCAIVYEDDTDFGDLEVVPPVQKQREIIPSQEIDQTKLFHLTETQRNELLALLDRYADSFSETPGFCDVVEHEIHVTSDFKPKRLKAYRVPENLKPQVDQQIREMLESGIIRPSKSEMASPVVCVLKGKGGRDGVRLAIDYRYLNKYCTGDAYPMPDIGEIMQRVGKCNWISLCDIKSAYWNIPVKQEHQWLTAFVWNDGLYEFTRAPFGQKSSGHAFVRAIKQILRPLKEFADSYIDDTSVFSYSFPGHLEHLEKFLQAIRASGLKLNLKKCVFAQRSIPFLGQIVGSGVRKPDPEKIAAVQYMKSPKTKREVRQVMGFFSYFREYIPKFAELAKPITDLTSKRVSDKIPWGEKQEQAFKALKQALCDATERSLQIVDCSKPYILHVDASDVAVSGILLQSDDNGNERPVAFISAKLTDSQRSWSTVERESYAAIWALNKFRNWIFARPVVLFSDHNPLTYITESAPKSPKLMRWALALQQYDVTFRYKTGKSNVAADCLSRMVSDNEGVPPREEVP